MEKEKQLLVLCRSLIEQQLNWGDSNTWSNDDFEQLSEKIFEKTKVQLSVSTLKRIWGKVRYENFPTTGTLNALAGFLDYESWRDFRQQNPISERTNESQEKEISIPEAPIIIPPDADKKTKRSYLKTIGLTVLVAGVLIISAAVYLVPKHVQVIADSSKIKFEAIKASDNLPNSVLFNYDASALKPDSVFIQQSWDPERRERVAEYGKQHTSIYYNPGFFIAKLIVNGEIKKQCAVFIKTKGWKGIIEKSPVPIYLAKSDIKSKGCMGITDSLLRQKTGLPVFNDTWVKFANVREFKDIDAGNFSLETTLRNASAMEASVCRMIKVVLLGTGKAIIIPLADKGCVSDIDLLTGDIWISGKDHDMRAFGCDFSRFQNLKCSVEKHRFKIYLNNKLIMDMPQKQTLGEIVGIRFESEGAAQIKYLKLSTPGAGVYEDHF